MDKENKPKFSVIVPVYKVESYLSECIESILAQTFTDFELILVDDGSPDKSGAICDAYAEQDSRVRVFHKENGGVSSARNLGIDHARGEYICFFDGDDTVSPKILEEFDKACQGDVEVVVCGFSYCDVNLKPWQIVAPRKRGEQDAFCDFVADLFLGGACSSACNKCIKHDFLTLNGLRFKEWLGFGEDTIFVTQCVQYTKSISVIPDSLYNYRRYTGTAVSQYYPNIQEIYQILCEETIKIPEIQKAGRFDDLMKKCFGIFISQLSNPECSKSFWEKIKVVRWALSFMPLKKIAIRTRVGQLRYSTKSAALLLLCMKMRMLFRREK